MKMRYTTWRHTFPLFWGLMAVSVAGQIYFREVPLSVAFEVLMWVVIVVSVGFHVVVSLLQKAGLLEFTYTEKDRASYLYNQKKLHQQMSEKQRARKRE